MAFDLYTPEAGSTELAGKQADLPRQRSELPPGRHHAGQAESVPSVIESARQLPQLLDNLHHRQGIPLAVGEQVGAQPLALGGVHRLAAQ